MRSITDASLTPLLSAAFRMSRQLRVILSVKLAEFEVDVGQDHLLAVLEPERSVSVGGLAHILGVRPSTISRMVNRIAASGLLERQANARDTRKSFISLTPLGGHVRSQVLKTWAEVDADLRADLQDADEVERQVWAVDARLTAYVSQLR